MCKNRSSLRLFHEFNNGTADVQADTYSVQHTTTARGCLASIFSINNAGYTLNTTTTTTVLRPFFRDHPGEPVPEENLWTLRRKGRLTEADTLTIWLGTTPSGLTSAYLHHPPVLDPSLKETVGN